MKAVTIIVLSLLFFSCAKDKIVCKTCYNKIESDERKQNGYANNGWDPVSTVTYGEVCEPTLSKLLANPVSYQKVSNFQYRTTFYCK